MITKIVIDGFKSLVNVNVELGPFTCIAGTNAVGKSNFFDALIFLSNLADKTLIDAARSVRSDDKKYTNIKDIFHRVGSAHENTIRFELSLLIPDQTEDDLGQPASASITSLQYNLTLKYNENDDENPISIDHEELVPIPLRDARKSIRFEASKIWKNDVISGRKTTPFISTQDGIVKIHQDTKGGAAVSYQMNKMQRTLLSSATAEYPTAFMVRHELRSWRMLQLEPSALRKPDDFDIRRNAQLAPNGAHLAATLYRLRSEAKTHDVYQVVTNKLASIIDGLEYVSVDRDEKRELLNLQIKYKDGGTFPANTLSDGTLRFLGLTVLELDNKTDGVICFEEPENGIHPLKIAAIIELLQRIAVDTNFSVDENNPFRQVIINTHSPLVVSIVPDDSLLMAELQECYNPVLDAKYQRTVFKGLSGTWRNHDNSQHIITKGSILNFLSPIEHPQHETQQTSAKKVSRRVIDRTEIKSQLSFLFPDQ